MQNDLFPSYESMPPPGLLTGDDVVTEGTAASWATMSTCGLFRYLLGRQWNDGAPWLVLCMLNPSKADALMNDPTVTRGLGFAKRDNFGGLLVANGFGLRATDPRELLTATDPNGPRNDEAILAAAAIPRARVVAAWGAPPNKRIRGRLELVRKNLSRRRALWVLGPLTKGGYPRHPLYLRSDTPIVRWPA